MKSKMSKNRLVIDIIDAIELCSSESDSTSTILCGECTTDPSEFHCVTCVKFFCNDCGRVHEKKPTNRSHTFLTLEEFKQSKPLSVTPIPVCDRHNEIYKFYCVSCRIPVCTDCMQLDHRKPECKPVSLSEAFNEKKEILQQSIAKANTTVEYLTTASTNIKNMIQESGKAKQKIIDSINLEFTALTLQLNKRQKDLEQRCDESMNQSCKQLSLQVSDLDMSIASALSLTHMTDKMLSTPNQEVEVLNLHNQLQDQLRRCIQQSYTTSPCASTDIMFVRNEKSESIIRTIHNVYLRNVYEIEQKKLQTEKESRLKNLKEEEDNELKELQEEEKKKKAEIWGRAVQSTLRYVIRILQQKFNNNLCCKEDVVKVLERTLSQYIKQYIETNT